MTLQWVGIDGTTPISATNEEFAQLREWLRVDGKLESRISNLFWRDMYEGYTRRSLNCNAVLDAVSNLERGERHSGVKPASRFRNPPLKGLWHKHYYSAQALSNNVFLQLSTKGGMKRLSDDISGGGKTALQIATRTVLGSLSDRSSAGKLTGEWVIFAKFGNENYYLSLGEHRIDDQIQYNRIIKYCIHDFPDLKQWLT
ncbi:hypothetical protein [Ensifer sp. ENS08]|uniref:hypothetical protein n=1 Tax=Ensifer sp. ENS08 TaxID=2769273 RepID=UPI0017849C26|nr:hypothetical protein [Ensifer sp. ENS08]MBD9569015.1 hypothetical protein [Ensifer sp. ENS08]